MDIFVRDIEAKFNARILCRGQQTVNIVDTDSRVAGGASRGSIALTQEMSRLKTTAVASFEATESAQLAHVHESVNGLVDKTGGIREGYVRALTEILEAEHEMQGGVRENE